MTAPAALPTALPGVALPSSEPAGQSEDPAAADAFAQLLATMGAGVAVPVPLPSPAPAAPAEQDTTAPTDPVPSQTAVATTGALPTPPGAAHRREGVEGGPTDRAHNPSPNASPVAWAATTQRSLLAADPPSGGARPGPAPSGGAEHAAAAAGELPPTAMGRPAPPSVPGQDVADAGAAATMPGAGVEHAADTADAADHLPPTAQATPAEQAIPMQEPLALQEPAPLAAPSAPLATTSPLQSELPATPSVGRTSTVSPALVEAARGLQQEGGGRTSLVVRLDPPELGAVVVRLTVLDGRVDVHLRTPDLTARADLQAQTWDVQQVLRAHGLDLGSYDVKHGELFTGGGQSDARTPDRGTPQQRRPADGHSGQLSLHTAVTDDVTSPQSAGTWL